MSKWVTAWGVPTSYAESGIANYIKDTTFRQIFYSPIGGKRVKIRFTNVYNSEDVILDKVCFAEWSGDGSKIIEGSSKTVQFSQNGNVVKAGFDLVSDAFDYEIEPQKNYVVSFYIKELVEAKTGYNKFAGDKASPCWLARGDYAESVEFLPTNRTEVTNCITLSGVDVETDDDTFAIMAFGDSITARPWPDFLAKRINNEGIYSVSVVRKAIGGNRILRDYRDILARRRMGHAAIERFEMSMDQIEGAKVVIMLEGINDIMHPFPDSPFADMSQLPTADELIEGYKKCIDIAHSKGAKMYLCTILPCKRMLTYCGDRNGLREKVNEWIRTNDYADGYIEFEKAVADKDEPTKLALEFDSGDELHPSEAGSYALCNAVPDYIYKK